MDYQFSKKYLIRLLSILFLLSCAQAFYSGTSRTDTVKIRFAVILWGVLAAVHLQYVDAVALIPVQPVVVVVATITAVAGGAGFSGLPAAVESPHAGHGDFSRAAVLIADRQRGQDESAEQYEGEDD